MSVSSINSSVSGLSYMNQMQHKGSGEGQMKDTIQGMSEEDQSEFKSKMQSMSQEQKMQFKSMMQENKGDISQMSQEDATASIFELLDEVSSVDGVSKTDGVSILDVLDTDTDTETSISSNKDSQDPLANLSEENLSQFLDILNSMSKEQKQEFGFSLMDSKEELATLESDEAADVVMSLLEDASVSTTNSLTQEAMSKFTRGGSFIDIYS